MRRWNGFAMGCLAVAVLANHTPAAGQVNQAAIAEVAAGTVKEAKASWWGFDEADATRCLQQAIDSKVEKLIVDQVGKPWIVTPLKLASNQEILFEKGVEVLAKAGAFQGTGDSLFTGRLAENITLRGYGATLRMRRSDYDDASRYRRAEWRHVLQFLSCRNVNVLGLTLTESGGDGIYLGAAKTGVTNQNVIIRDVTCHRNYRQGISVITAENLLIENTILSDTAGTAPQAGIDFEPNGPDERIVRCLLKNCVARNNAGGGFVAYLPNLNAKSAPVSLRVEQCKSTGNRGDAVALTTHNAPDSAVTGTLELIGCELSDTPAAGIAIGGNPSTGCRIQIKDCLLTNTATANPTDAPIVFSATPGSDQDLGGATFDNVTIRDAIKRPPIQLSDQSGTGLGVNVSGNISLDQDGQQRRIELTATTLAEWIPAAAIKRIPRVRLDGLVFQPLEQRPSGRKDALPAWQLRGTGRACVWAKAGEHVTVTVNSGRVGKYAASPIEVVVSSPLKQERHKVQIPFGEDSAVSFTALETGLHDIQISSGANFAYFTSSTHPLCLNSQPGSVHLVYTTGTLYFTVPAGTTEFGVRLFGEGRGEGVKGTLRNPAGVVVGEQDKITNLYQFTVENTSVTPGLWSLSIARPTGITLEDYHIGLVGIPPLIAPTRTAALVLHGL